MTPDAPGYARRVRTFSATMMVMGGIIGAGIFINPAIVAQRVAEPVATVGVWVIGGLVALCGAFCFAELGSRYPRSGGGYVYLREALHPLAGFLYGWAVLLVIATGAIAAVAVTFARYAVVLVGGDAGSPVVILVAIDAILLLTAVNYLGIRPGSVTQNVFTILKLAALAGLIAVGLLNPASPTSTEPAASAESASWLAAIGMALVPVLFSYGGWQQTNFVADEIVEPERTLPKALVIGVLGVVLVYGLANFVYVYQLGVDGLAASETPAADVMRSLLGRPGEVFISAGIAASTFGFLNLVILVTPRVYQAMARDGLFFKPFADLDPRFRTPGLALGLQAVWAIVLVQSGTYGALLDYVVFADFIFFGLAGIALIVFRRRHGRQGVAFLCPGYPWVPCIFIAGAFFTVFGSVESNPGNAAVGVGMLALGVPVYLFWSRRR